MRDSQRFSECGLDLGRHHPGVPGIAGCENLHSAAETAAAIRTLSTLPALRTHEGFLLYCVPRGSNCLLQSRHIIFVAWLSLENLNDWIFGGFRDDNKFRDDALCAKRMHERQQPSGVEHKLSK